MWAMGILYSLSPLICPLGRTIWETLMSTRNQCRASRPSSSEAGNIGRESHHCSDDYPTTSPFLHQRSSRDPPSPSSHYRLNHLHLLIHCLLHLQHLSLCTPPIPPLTPNHSLTPQSMSGYRQCQRASHGQPNPSDGSHARRIR